MRKRLEFSQYIVDPNQFRCRKVIRIVALVMLFINKLKSATNSTSKSHIMGQQSCKAVLQNLPIDFKITEYLVTSGKNHTINPTGNEIKCRQGLVIILTGVELGEALNYYSTKANKKSYESISEEISGVLCYTGGILPHEFSGNKNLSDVMHDLSSITFHVSLVDHKSPIAYSIINEVHWYNKVAKHSGVETVLRYTMKYAYIMGGRDLVRLFKKACIRCRILAKRTIDI